MLGKKDILKYENTMDIKGIPMDIKKKCLKNSKWDVYQNPNEPQKQHFLPPKLK